MTKFVLRSIKYTGIISGSLIAFLIVITLIVNFFFKRQIVEYILEQVSNQVDAQIHFEEMEFSIWQKFPNASVFFTKVYAQSSNQYKIVNKIGNKNDTLLVADKIFLELNLLKLIKGDYQLKRLNVKNGYLKLSIDKEGKANYNILKKSEKPSTKEFNLELNDLVFTNTILEYNNLKAGVNFKGTAKKLNIQGNFKQQTYDLKIQSDFFANKLVVANRSYIIDKMLKLDFILLVDKNNYQIKNANFKIKRLQFFASGDFNLGETAKINLQVNGHKLDLSQVMDALPDHFHTALKDYSGEGKTELILNVKGPIGKQNNPKVELKFSLTDAAITQNIAGIKLHNIELQGSFSNGISKNMLSSTIKIVQFKSNLGSGNICGSCVIENLSQPQIAITISSKLDLNELKKFFKLDTLEILSGSLESNVFASARLDKIDKLKLSDIKNIKCTGQIKLSDAGIKMKKSDYYFEQINGTITLKNDIFFNNISIMVLGNDFLINGSLTDGLQYFLKQRKDLTLQAEVISRNLDLSKYFVKNPTNNNTKYSRELLFPEDINLDVKINVNNFKLNKFNAKWCTGYISYKPKMFVLKTISLETLSGHLSGNGVVIQDMYKNFIVKGQVDISRIDIQQMFYTFNNFSQIVIEDRHLRGHVSGKVNLSTEWNNALVANLDKVIVESDLTIVNGELVNYEPLRGLSDYISVKELENIKFSILKNRIYIKDRQVVIPQMDVVSSAFNITASGVHKFDNHYTYKLKILLSDILWGKAKKAKRENSEFGVVEDDGLGKTSIPLSIVGYKKDYKISYDTKQSLNIVKESLDKQKQDLKSVFNKEFGWFKKDSTLKKNNQKNNALKVQWDEENPPDEKPVENTESTKTEPKKTKPREAVKKPSEVKVEFEP